MSMSITWVERCCIRNRSEKNYQDMFHHDMDVDVGLDRVLFLIVADYYCNTSSLLAAVDPSYLCLFLQIAKNLQIWTGRYDKYRQTLPLPILNIHLQQAASIFHKPKAKESDVFAKEKRDASFYH